MEINAVNSYVIVNVKSSEEEIKSAGGIYIPKTSNEQVVNGEVTSVGPGSYQDGVLVAPQVKVGQKVVFDKGMGRILESRGADKTYAVMDAHIIGTL